MAEGGAMTAGRADVEQFQGQIGRLREEIGKVIVGNHEVVDGALTCMLAGSHALLEGVPGLGKTVLVKTMAEALALRFSRVQFTPDLMPADIIGTTVIDESSHGQKSFSFRKGPIFANIILADEINRTPPKTQSALLEAMQERSVTVEGKTYILDKPFFVLATQNPIELEGTYPLPEAQLDRFMFNIIIGYLSEDEEISVVDQTTTVRDIVFEKTIGGPEIVEYQKLVRKMPVAEPVTRYAVQLARTSRPSSPNAPDFVKQYVNYGASLRASQFLILGAKARALMSGRYNVSVEDVQKLCFPVFRHRILLNFHAESEGITSDKIIQQLIDVVPVPKSGIKD